MSGPASLSGALPPGDGNGLGAIAGDLIADPKQVRVAVILFDVAKVAHRVDDGTRQATVRVRRIEVITDPGDRDAMRNLLQREFERRLGLTVLPFELENDVSSAFDPTGSPHVRPPAAAADDDDVEDEQ